MSGKITVLLADADRAARLALRTFLTEQDAFQVVGEAYDGPQTLALVHELHPQIVLAELWLPEIDGLLLLRHFRQMDSPPWAFILSAFCADHIRAEAARRGAFYCMAKPVDTVTLVEQMLLASHTPQSTTFSIARSLHRLSIPHASPAFRFLEVAIRLGIEDPDILHAMVKELYPAVAAETNSTAGCVEVEMRRAITVAWERGDPAVWREGFPYAARRPTNSDFIATMADALRPISMR